MTFLLTEDQQMLRDTALAFARDELPVSHLRALRDAGANGADPETRQKLAELGFFGVIIPDEPGGEHFGLVGLGQILEVQGRTLAATPLLQTALIAASVFELAGDMDLARNWLPKIASGEVTFALALDEGAHHAPNRIALRANRADGGYRLDGSKRFVPDGQHADMFIVVGRTSGEATDEAGIGLFLVPRDADGVAVQTLNTLDAHGAAHLVFDGAVGTPIGKVDEGYPVLDAVLDRARAGLAAEMLGSASAAFEMTLDYLQTRKQFGQLIGSFQALQHRAAIMFTELELTRSAVVAALSAIDAG
ncbi:MAG: acyl-CoA dehydrogenase family protein, partial [Pseudomonadota bacterium]